MKPFRHLSRFGLFVLASLLTCSGAEKQDGSASLGIFENQNDVGKVLHPGSAEYDLSTQSYTISGGGENMWFASDEFHSYGRRFRHKI